MAANDSKLLLALETIRASGLQSTQRELIAAVASQVTSLGATGMIDPDGAALLKAFVTGLSHVATSEHANKLLNAQEIALVSTDICNACAVGGGENTVVFIFQGLIKSAMFFLEFAEIVHAIDTGIKNGTARIAIAQGEFERLVFQAYAGLYHYMATAAPLIRAGERIPAAAKASLMIRFARVLWFVLMHEIGHIQLGHVGLASSNAVSVSPALICPEDLNTFKLQEFEADLYLCDTLKGGEQYALMSYVLAPLDMFASFERNLGPSGQTHPMAINRLQNILVRRRPFLDETSIAAAEEIIARDHLAIDPIRLTQRKYSPQTKREEAGAAIQVLKDYFANLPQSAEATADQAERAELWDYTVEYFWATRARVL